MLFADRQRPDQLPGAVIGTGDIAHLALVDQIIECPQRFFNRSGIVRGVGIINIEVIRSQPPQAIFDGLQDMFEGESGIVGAGTLAVSHFRGQHHLMPLVFQGFADNLFRAAAGIAVGSIEGVDAFFERQVNYFIGFSLVYLLPEDHRAQGNFGDF